MDRFFIVLAGVYGSLAVGLGAFGAHGLRGMLRDAPDAADRLGWWQTAAHYHLVHALALGLCAWLASRGEGMSARVAGYAFALGVVIFSGTLYSMALGGPRWLGAITPIGGVSLILGWVAVVVAAWRP